MSLADQFRSVFLFLLSLTIFILISGCTTPEGNPEDGKRWYIMHTCYACHGEDGKGRGGGPAITGLDMSYRSFVKRLRHSETAIMPAYGADKISDQDAADILAYLNSVE